MVAVAVLLGAPAALAACGGSGRQRGHPHRRCPHHRSGGPELHGPDGVVAGLGRVLVDGYGLTLYLFVPDGQSGKSTCSGYSASRWPPLTLPAGVTTPFVGPGADGALVKTTRRSDGALQVTYDGWPLYHWIGDTAAGQDNGQNIDDSGGYWYAVDPAGQAVH